MPTLMLKAPAKINLSLKILDKRPDGYHNLQSEFQTVTLFDQIKLTVIPEGIQLSATGKYKIPNNRDNFVYQVAEKLRAYAQKKVGIKIEIEKNTPLFAGLGGGSSDAAAVIKGLNELWQLKLNLEKQLEIGKTIGADVPFFLYGGHCLVEGIGEKITPLPPLAEGKFIVIAQLPHIRIATVWAYHQLDKLRITNYGLTKRGCAEVASFKSQVSSRKLQAPTSNLQSLTAINNNDFESVIFQHFPDLANLKNAFLAQGAHQAALTGSGSAVYGIFQNLKIAQKCLEKLRPECGFITLAQPFLHNEE